jgi:hypothetical protein
MSIECNCLDCGYAIPSVVSGIYQTCSSLCSRCAMKRVQAAREERVRTIHTTTNRVKQVRAINARIQRELEAKEEEEKAEAEVQAQAETGAPKSSYTAYTSGAEARAERLADERRRQAAAILALPPAAEPDVYQGPVDITGRPLPIPNRLNPLRR